MAQKFRDAVERLAMGEKLTDGAPRDVIDEPAPSRKGMAKVPAFTLGAVTVQPADEPLAVHPLANIFPPMAPDEMERLKDSVEEHGQGEPITVWDGQIVDGRHRYQVCQALGISCRIRDFTGQEADLAHFVLAQNLTRRHLNETQRAMVAAKVVAHLRSGSAKLHGDTLQLAADMLNVSRRSTASARKVCKHGIEQLVEALEEGHVRVYKAANIAGLPSQEQAEIVARGEKEILAKASAIRKAREAHSREKKRRRLLEQARQAPPLTSLSMCYPVILADPAWRYDHSISASRDIENHYGTMPTEKICGLPVADIATSQCSRNLRDLGAFLITLAEAR
jgi:ParB-like chromosome segregation protein Spo0J